MIIRRDRRKRLNDIKEEEASYKYAKVQVQVQVQSTSMPKRDENDGGNDRFIGEGITCGR